MNFRIEDGIATPDIRQNRMFSTAVVADRNLVFLTGMATVTVIGTVGQKSAEHTMFGVKNRQMTERDDFQILWRDVVGKFCDLLPVLIVGGRDAFEPHL